MNTINKLLIIFFAISLVSCGEVQKYYIPEVNLYIELRDNYFSKEGCIYFRHNKRVDNSCKEYIVVTRTCYTDLVINLKEKNKIYIRFNGQKITDSKQDEVKFIEVNESLDSVFYRNLDTGEPKILKDDYIEIIIGESLERLWIKKANETSFSEIKEIDR